MTPNELTARAALMADHFYSDGQLYGVDILTGARLAEITPVDVSDFFNVHQLGPGRFCQGAKAKVVTESGEEMMGTSFYRPMVRPFDREGSASFFSISVTEQEGIEVTGYIRSLIDILRDEEYEPILERSFRLCRWEVWVLLDDRYGQDDLTRELYRLEATIRDKMGLENVQLPALSANSDVHLPYQFFAGDFFGQLYQLFECLSPLDLTAVPHTALGGGELKLVNYVGNTSPQIEAFVDAWWNAYGAKPMRAGKLMKLIHSASFEIPEVSNQLNPQAQAIELGNLLLGLDGRMIAEKTILARRSGNSRVYSLVPFYKSEPR